MVRYRGDQALEALHEYVPLPCFSPFETKLGHYPSKRGPTLQ